MEVVWGPIIEVFICALSSSKINRYVFLFQVLIRSHVWSRETSVPTRRSLIQHCMLSRAQSTISKYMREVKLFFQHQLAQNRPCSLPANLMDVSIYLSYVLDQHKVSSAGMAYAALKWVHSLLPASINPLDAAICTNLVKAEKRLRPGPVRKKEPATPELLASIVSSYAHNGASLKDLRLATMCVLSFVGLFRSAELLSIKACESPFIRIILL